MRNPDLSTRAIEYGLTAALIGAASLVAFASAILV